MRILYLLVDMYVVDSEITVIFGSTTHTDCLSFTLPVAHLYRCILNCEPSSARHNVQLLIHGVLFYVPISTYYELRRRFDKLTK